jgi:hypothetical protein
VIMKNVVLWYVALCKSCINRRFGLRPPADAGFRLTDFSTLKMKVIRSSETSVKARATQRHIPEDDILQRKKLFVVIFFTCES